MVRSILVISVIALAGGAASGQVTGSITGSTPNPLSYVLPLSGSDTGVVNTRVLIEDGPGSGDVDVLFAIDTSGSMGPFLGTVQPILSTVLGALPAGFNYNFAVAEYKDARDGLIAPDLTNRGWRLNQSFTSSIAATQAAINGLSATGGGDWPEANFNAIGDAAVNWTGYMNGRNTAQKIVINAGDALAHNGTIPASDGGPGFYRDLDNVTSALQARGATYFGITNDSASGFFGIDGRATDWGGTDSRRQASHLASNTGGQNFFNVAFGDAAAIAAAISSAIVGGSTNVGLISLTVDGAIGDWTVNVLNSPRVGPFGPGDSPVLTDFNLAITGPNYLDFRVVQLTLRANGAPLASVPLSLRTIPTPGALALLGLGGLVAARRRRA